MDYNPMMSKAAKHRIKAIIKDDDPYIGYCSEYIPPADDLEEGMLFVEENGALMESDIISIEILD